MRLPAFLEHQAERRADQARVTVLTDFLFVSAFTLVLALMWFA